MGRGQYLFFYPSPLECLFISSSVILMHAGTTFKYNQTSAIANGVVGWHELGWSRGEEGKEGRREGEEREGVSEGIRFINCSPDLSEQDQTVLVASMNIH